jgi:hypothetical protein
MASVIIRSPTDYQKAVERLSVLSTRPASSSEPERASLIQAMEHHECVTSLFRGQYSKGGNRAA